MNAEIQTLFDQAEALFQRGNYSVCRPLYERIAFLHPDSYPDVHNRLGLIHHAAGRMEDAAVCFERALAANPSYIDAALNLVVTYNDLGRFEDAEEVFMGAAGQVAEDDTAATLGVIANRHVALGDDYARIGRLEDALREYRRALTLRPTYVDVVCKVGGTLRRQGLADEALRVFARAKELNARFPDPYVQCGLIYFKKGFHDMAMGEWQHALALDPSRRDAEAFLATVRRALLQQ